MIPVYQCEINDLTLRIQNYLLDKVRREFKKIDATNKFRLDSVYFWFHQDEFGNLYLIYDKHPKMWDYYNMSIQLNLLEAENLQF